MNYKETLNLLYTMMPDFQKVGAGAYKPGLERIEEFNRYLESPDKSFCAIHVAGTNGKGSVSHMIASVLMSAGYRVGLYTSPHLRDFRERIKIDGQMITEEYVVDFTQRHLDKMKDLDLSFFEATVGMAFDWFNRNDVEIAVIETGLGGRLDATNIITPALSVITNIGMDHMAFLGDSIESIASEKGGIIKKGVPTLIGERDSRSEPIFTDRALQKKSQLFFAEDMYEYISSRPETPSGVCEREGMRMSYTLRQREDLKEITVSLDLLGNYQRRNIVTAVAACFLLNKLTPITISKRALKEGLASASITTGLNGRWQILSYCPLTVCDTAHNAHGLKYVVEQIKQQEYQKLYFVLGVVDDKDLNSILPLLPEDAHYIFTRASVDRSLPAEKLAQEAVNNGLKGEIIGSVPEAVVRAQSLASPRDMIFIGGSTFVVADI